MALQQAPQKMKKASVGGSRSSVRDGDGCLDLGWERQGECKVGVCDASSGEKSEATVVLAFVNARTAITSIYHVPEAKWISARMQTLIGKTVVPDRRVCARARSAGAVYRYRIG